MNDMDIEELRKTMSYDPATGRFWWKARPDWSPKKNATYAGKEAMLTSLNGALGCHVDGRFISAHRAAWALHYGEWPAYGFRHINGNKRDNRIENLTADRPKDFDEKNSRLRKTYVTNTSGRKGVSYVERMKKWKAYISVDGKQIVLGHFQWLEEAIEAREKAEKEYWGL